MHKAKRMSLAAAAATAFVLILGGSTATSNVATVAASSCSFPYPTWSTGLKNATGLAQGPLTDIDAAKHTCFDRVVLRRVAGEAWPSYDVRYVSQAYTEATGCPASVGAGNKVLRISIGAPNRTEYGVATTSNTLRLSTTPGACESIATPVRTWTDDIHVSSTPLSFTGYNSIRQAKWLGSQHGTSSIALGIAGSKKVRVSLANGNRDLVVDVAK